MADMNVNKIAVSTLGLIVMVVLFAAILVPIVESSIQTESTFENGGYFTYDVIGSDAGTKIVTWDRTEPGIVKVDGEPIQMPSGSGSWTIIGSENFCLRYYSNSTTAGIQCYGSSGYLASNIASGTDARITVTASNVKFERYGDSNATQNYPIGTHGFLVNPEGNGALSLKYSDESAYVLKDSEIYLCGTTFVTGSGTNDFVGVYGYGSLEDGLTMSSFYGNSSPNTVSFGEVVATYTEVSGFNDLLRLDKFEFPLNQNSATVTATYSYFVVPTEVTAEKSVHASGTEISLISLIPILVLAGLVIGVVGSFIRNRD